MIYMYVKLTFMVEVMVCCMGIDVGPIRGALKSIPISNTKVEAT